MGNPACILLITYASFNATQRTAPLVLENIHSRIGVGIRLLLSDNPYVICVGGMGMGMAGVGGTVRNAHNN